ncbi:uncharacterized protein [Branchiostoma lanceolatum]|uniref:uncharacterized protein n=1 Tax=Branchiostoma lanceolatum TaxID=7740 RepID=UPI003456A252
MLAAQADLPDPDSTTELVAQHGTQLQRRGHQASLEGQTDTSPAHVEDPLRDVHSDALFEHSDQDDQPGFSPDNSEDRSSLPVICTSYTNAGKTERNQALYVDNPPIEAGESPSKDIYDTEIHNAESVMQYQLRGACHKEAVSTFYQCGQDVDDARMDRPPDEVCGANSEAEIIDHDEIQTETGVKRLENVENSSQNRTESEVKSHDESILPHAVLHDHNRTHDEQGDVFDVQPQAGTNDEDEGHYENQNVDSFQSICGQPNISSDTASSVKEMRGRGRRFNDAVDKGDELLPNPMHSGNALIPNPMYSGNALIPNPMYSGNALIPNPMYSGNALIPNPMYSGNALRPNPMYVPNVPQPRANGGKIS